MDIPWKEVAFVCGGGIAVILVTQVFKFVKWFGKFIGKKGLNPDEGQDKTDRELDEVILDEVKGIAKTTGQTQAAIGVVKTRLEYFEKTQIAHTEELKEVTGKIDGVGRQVTDQILRCERRFGKLEKAVNNPKSRRRTE